MRSKHYLVLVAAGLSIAGLAACGDDVNQGTGGTGGTGASTTSSTGGPTTSTTMSGPTTSSTGAGGATDDHNNSFEEAEDTTIGMMGGVTGDIDPIETDYDYFKFMGKKGQVLWFQTDAKPDMDPFADGYPDLVLTVYGADKAQLAENDDPIPRGTQDSEIFTILPADGLYYMRITDFCTWSADEKGMPCPTGQQSSANGTAYTIFITELDPAVNSITADTEKGNDIASADVLEYELNPNSTNGAYFTSINYGTFADATDIDVFEFTVPADAPVTDGRLTAYFEAFPAGADGNGSTTPVGKMWVTDATDPLKLGEIDVSKIDPTFGMTLSPPVDPGTKYYVHVQHPVGGTPGTNPFYFFLHYAAGGNPLETNELGNDLIAGAEPLTSAATTGGGTGYFIAGNIGLATDVDFFSFDNAQVDPTDKFFATCAGQRIGSGLRGLKLSLLKSDGSVITTATETPEDSANLGDAGFDVPTGEGTFILKVETTAAADIANNKGTYYQCGVGFFAPAM